jgi:hypothetical protein
MLDHERQPVNTNFNASRRLTRDICEMLGLVKGVLADGSVSEAEARLLHEWTRAHPEAVAEFPGNRLLARLERIFADGQVSDAERLDLEDLLRQLVGGKAGIIAGTDAATTLPLNTPPPVIAFPERSFVFTGKFAFGPRSECERVVSALGGKISGTVSKRVHFLVIGTFGSRDWIHTSYGRKIQKAVEIRENGHQIGIVSEDHWAAAVP